MMQRKNRIAAMVSAAAIAMSVSGISAFAAEDSTNSIQQMIDSMTTEQKIEQMIAITLRPWSDGTEGSEKTNVTSLNETQRAFIERHNFGGIVLFAPNIQGIEQCVAFTDEIQQAALNSECSIPMLIAADQEGGKIYRLQTGTPTSGNMALGAAGDPQYAFTNAQILGSEIMALGINTNLAPVLDVNNNPANPIINLRSFSSDPELVSKMGAQYIKGLQSEGVITTVKHFPGHGDTATDSHTGLPMIDKSYEDLQKMELYPYTAAVEAGTDMVMTAHIQFPQIEKETYISKSSGEEVYIPATLSKTVITDVLRGDYHYDGVVATDSMVMDAIQVNFDLVDSAVMALNADVDLILEPMYITCPEEIDKMEQYIADVAEQVKEEKIPMSTIDKSVERILTMKQKRGILDYHAPDPAESLKIVGSAEHREKALEVAEKGITLVKNDDNILPLKLGENGNVAFFFGYANVENTMGFALDRMKKEGVVSEGVTASCVCFRGHDASEYEEVIQNSDAVILALEMYNTGTLTPTDTSRGWQSAFAEKLIALAHQNGKKVIYLSAHIPYDLARFPEADAILASYCANGMAQIPEDGQEIPAYGVNYPAALITIFGGNAPTGKLPVDIYAFDENMQYTDELLYPLGYGLNYSTEQPGAQEMIASADDLKDYAVFEYNKKNGNKAADAEISIDSGNTSAVITVKSQLGQSLETYTIDPVTGTGTDSKGNAVDLSGYVTAPESKYFAPLEQLNEMAKTDFEQKTGLACNAAEGALSEDGKTYTVTLTDASGKMLDQYKINPFTGYGESASEAEVALPQTGSNACDTAAAVASALLMTVFGWAAIAKSGVLRKKDE